jgi:hypothetical protein
VVFPDYQEKKKYIKFARKYAELTTGTLRFKPCSHNLSIRPMISLGELKMIGGTYILSL